ncbi:hypothetical protein AB4Y43_01235 [Paraburkholderia sp. BR10872]|uniref:hypothetical protein n=1 Tax=Paraburkholderia sp. BR10872 TaxID=3236989 RepID=UPI0034D319FF
MTELFPPEIKPVHVGWYSTEWFDAGWDYELRVWWDGQDWRNEPNGWRLMCQKVSWRGLKEQENADNS